MESLEVTTPQLSDRAWIAACSHRLHRHWSTLTPSTLEIAAAEIKADAQLGKLDPIEAAAAWLRRAMPSVTVDG